MNTEQQIRAYHLLAMTTGALWACAPTGNDAIQRLVADNKKFLEEVWSQGNPQAQDVLKEKE